MTFSAPRHATVDAAPAAGFAAGRSERKPNDPAKHRIHVARWIERHPQKRAAHHAVRNALRRGEMERGLCHCGAVGEAHHHDYSKPLDVVFLCRRHHAAEHRKAAAR